MHSDKKINKNEKSTRVVIRINDYPQRPRLYMSLYLYVYYVQDILYSVIPGLRVLFSKLPLYTQTYDVQ